MVCKCKELVSFTSEPPVSYARTIYHIVSYSSVHMHDWWVSSVQVGDERSSDARNNLELDMTMHLTRGSCRVSIHQARSLHIPSCIAGASHVSRHTWHAAVGPTCMAHVKRGGGPRAIDRGCIISYPLVHIFFFFWNVGAYLYKALRAVCASRTMMETLLP